MHPTLYPMHLPSRSEKQEGIDQGHILIKALKWSSYLNQALMLCNLKFIGTINKWMLSKQTTIAKLYRLQVIFRNTISIGELYSCTMYTYMYTSNAESKKTEGSMSHTERLM